MDLTFNKNDRLALCVPTGPDGQPLHPPCTVVYDGKRAIEMTSYLNIYIRTTSSLTPHSLMTALGIIVRQAYENECIRYVDDDALSTRRCVDEYMCYAVNNFQRSSTVNFRYQLYFSSCVAYTSTTQKPEEKWFKVNCTSLDAIAALLRNGMRRSVRLFSPAIRTTEISFAALFNNELKDVSSVDEFIRYSMPHTNSYWTILHSLTPRTILHVQLTGHLIYDRRDVFVCDYDPYALCPNEDTSTIEDTTIPSPSVPAAEVVEPPPPVENPVPTVVNAFDVLTRKM